MNKSREQRGRTELLRKIATKPRGRNSPQTNENEMKGWTQEARGGIRANTVSSFQKDPCTLFNSPE